MKAQFITFEGIEGVGKSTNSDYFAKKLQSLNIPLIQTREPGGTPVGEAIRKVLLDDYEEPFLPKTEALLLYAARLQHVEFKMKPALSQGTWVLSDRFFDASFAYQGGGRRIDFAELKALNTWTLGDFKPDLTLLFDAPLEIALDRMMKRQKLDRIEKEKHDFFQRIRECYLQLAEDEPKRFRLIDASVSLDQVQAQLDIVIESLVANGR